MNIDSKPSIGILGGDKRLVYTEKYLEKEGYKVLASGFEKYPEQIKPYIPFIVLSPAFGRVRDTYIRNEKKYQARAARSVDAFSYDDEIMAAFHPELAEDTFEEELFQRMDTKRLWEAIGKLPMIQKCRLIEHFFKGKSCREIARCEGVHHRAVTKSIECALKNLKKTL